MSDIKKRLKGVTDAEIQKTVYKLVANLQINTTGAKRNRAYELVKKNK